MDIKSKVIGVVMGGVSAEREVSLKSGSAVLGALNELGYNCREVVVDDDVAEQLRHAGIDAAVIALHGGWGEDGCIQAMCEMLKIRYTGSGVLASALAMNKSQAKTIFAQHDIVTPRYCPGLNEEFVFQSMGMQVPIVVKPTAQGSTLGVSIVMDHSEFDAALENAKQYDDVPMVEEFIEGRELTAGVIDGEALGVVEIVPKSGFYDYSSKYLNGDTEYIAPAEISAEQTLELQQISVKAYQALGCMGAARVDFRLHPQRGPFVLEVNTIPGLTATSLLPMSAKVVGMNFTELVERMLKGAFAGA